MARRSSVTRSSAATSAAPTPGAPPPPPRAPSARRATGSASTATAAPARACSLTLLARAGESLQPRGHVQHGAALVVRLLPDAALDAGDGAAVGIDHLVEAAELGIELVVGDELPLALERLPVHVGRRTVALVHHEERVQALDLDPPLLLLVL